MGVLFVMGSPYSSSTVTFLRMDQDGCRRSNTGKTELHNVWYMTQIEEEDKVGREEG